MCNKNLVINRVKECIEMATKHFPDIDFKMPTILFTKKGTTAGTARPQSNELNFNMVLLNENVDHFVMQTVGHEVAHLMDHVVFNTFGLQFRFNNNGTRKRRQPHGKNWKAMMAVLGLDADRCHTYDTTNSRQGKRGSRASQTFDYLCTGCNQVMPMGATRHNRMASGKTTYTHCRGYEIIYQG